MTKILLVDDDMQLCQTIKGYLTGARHAVDSVNTGIEATPGRTQ